MRFFLRHYSVTYKFNICALQQSPFEWFKNAFSIFSQNFALNTPVNYDTHCYSILDNKN